MIINYSNQKVIKGKKSIFFAGPTPRNKEVKSWRPEAIAKIKQLGFDGVIYIPEYEGLREKEEYIEQALWEREALTEATVIMFWVPRKLPNMPAFTTNVEFGYWLHTGKVLYGRPDNAEKVKYLDWLYKIDYNKEPFNNLEELLKACIKMSNKEDSKRQ